MFSSEVIKYGKLSLPLGYRISGKAVVVSYKPSTVNLVSFWIVLLHINRIVIWEMQ